MAQLIFLPLIFLMMYFLLIKPQRKRQEEAARVRDRTAVGDEILTTSGMYGIVTAMDDEDVWLEVSENSEIRMARGAILRITQSVNDPEILELTEHSGATDAAENDREPEA